MFVVGILICFLSVFLQIGSVPAPICGEGLLDCRNGKCVPIYLACNSVDDCGNAFDESVCGPHAIRDECADSADNDCEQECYDQLISYRCGCVYGFRQINRTHCSYKGEAESPPSWTGSYYIQGILQLPYAEIKEPFAAWWDPAKNRSRIDYYGGMVKTYQLPSNGTFGHTYKIAPMTTEKIANQNTCFKVNGTKDGPVTTQSVLPDLTGFKFVTESTLVGITCKIWQKVERIGGKKNTYTMWVKSENNQPVRYEMMGYDSLLGSHYDKYYVDYMNMTKSNVTDEVFEPKTASFVGECGGFPGPGSAEHRILMNPMREYIHHDDAHVTHMFKHFKKTHGKKYKGKTEHQQRENNFRQNVRFIHSKNRAGLSYTLAVNHLADLHDKEMRLMNGRKHTPGYNGGLPFDKEKYSAVKVPDHIDWRLYGAVSPVKDQAVCGSCWSFGTAGTVEGSYFLKTGQLVRLSQQALMDCSWGEGNNACDGGEDYRAYQWIQKHGLPSEEAYGPYLAQDSYCKQNATATAHINGYVNVTSNDLDALKLAMVARGPISVSIDASHKTLSYYANGVYYDPDCKSDEDSLDHSVLAVGYGVLNGQAYWLIKNSWSTYWGNNGYVLMSMKGNNCGVATSPTFVLM